MQSFHIFILARVVSEIKQVYKNVGIYLLFSNVAKRDFATKHTPSPSGTPSNLEGEFFGVLCKVFNKRVISTF